MALRFDASGDSLTRTTTLPSITSYTLMAWVRRIGNGNGSYEAAFAFGDGGSTYAMYIRTNGVAVFALTEWTTDFTGSAITDNVWYHLAMTCAGTGAGQLLGYFNGALDITGNGRSITGSTLRICDESTGSAEWANMRVAAVKIYNGVLTANEILNEMQYYVPIRTANLNTWLPCIDPVANTNAVDWSGVGGNMTVGGTLTVEDGPPIAWGPIPEDVMGMAYTSTGAFPGGIEGVPLFGTRLGMMALPIPVMIPITV